MLVLSRVRFVFAFFMRLYIQDYTSIFVVAFGLFSALRRVAVAVDCAISPVQFSANPVYGIERNL